MFYHELRHFHGRFIQKEAVVPSRNDSSNIDFICKTWAAFCLQSLFEDPIMRPFCSALQVETSVVVRRKHLLL